jgi:hypothetical protein
VNGIPGTPSALAGTPYTGSVNTYSGAQFQGSIANIQVYNATLSPSGINALYREGIGGAPIQLQNLVAWWPLNGNANDYSGNNYNGAATNVIFTTTWTSGYTVHS